MEEVSGACRQGTRNDPSPCIQPASPRTGIDGRRPKESTHPAEVGTSGSGPTGAGGPHSRCSGLPTSPAGSPVAGKAQLEGPGLLCHSPPAARN